MLIKSHRTSDHSSRRVLHVIRRCSPDNYHFRRSSLHVVGATFFVEKAIVSHLDVVSVDESGFSFIGF